MVNKCIYCKCQLNDDSVFDVCQPCGHGVWGERMFNAILQNMGKAKESGDLYQGSISSQSRIVEEKKLIPFESQNQPEQPKLTVPERITPNPQEEILDREKEIEVSEPQEDAQMILDTGHELF
jgi:hypothetical protein